MTAKWPRVLAVLIVLLLASACRARIRVPAGPTHEPTEPLLAVPSDVPTSAPILPTAIIPPATNVPNSDATAASAPNIPPTSIPIPPTTAGATATLPPMQITSRGVIVFQLTDATSEVMASLEFNPITAKKELLVTLHDGVSAYVDRISWNGTAPDRKRLGEDVSSARYSPDASQIVFNGLLLGDANGAARKLIAPDGLTPSWSPTGDRIVFMRRVPPTTQACVNDAPDSCVSVISYDVAAQKEMVIITAPNIGGPATWSPDGKSLLVSIGGEAGSALGVIDIGAQKITLLVPNPDTPLDASNYTNAIWTANSDHVIYTTPDGSLWWLPVTGGASELLTSGGAEPYMPPKSRWVYYLATTVKDANSLAPQQVWRLDPTNPNGTAEQVLDTPMSCNHAVWSVNADLLACLGTVDNRQTITLYALPTAP